MPINAGPEFFAAEKRYSEARTAEDKIIALKEMIRTAPKHKGTENLLADLRKRLSKYKKELIIEHKKSHKSKNVIRKEGAAQICIIGPAGSGKSTLLNALTNAGARVADYPYTTKEPKVGMMLYDDMQFQMIEIPSSFGSDSMGLVHSCDVIIVLFDATKDAAKQRTQLMDFLKVNRLDKKKIIFVKNKSKVCNLNDQALCIDAKSKVGLEEMKEKIWQILGKIRVYTKSPEKPKAIPALALDKGSTVEDLAREIHKEFTKTFKFAKIFNSTKFSGKKVGMDYKLHDDDIVEIHAE